MAAAFKDFVMEYPNTEITVKSFSISQSKQGCDHPFDNSCFKCNAQVVFLDSDSVWFFGKSLFFPESATFNRWQKLIMSLAVEDWQEEFNKEGTTGYKGHGWFKFKSGGTGDRRRILPTHINRGPWLHEYGGVTIANDPGLCRHFIHAATKHVPIREYWQQFFPDEDFHCPGHMNAPETWDHILNECLWYVRRTGHYDGDIQTITGLTLFLCDNPQAFAFDQMEGLKRLQKD
jgi:hypothetical protein